MVNVKRTLKRIRNVYYLLVFLYENQSRFRRVLIKSGLLVTLAFTLVKLFKRLKKLFVKPASIRSSNMRAIKSAAAGDATASDNNSDHNNNVLANQAALNNPGVNKRFFRELYSLLKIMFPRIIFSKQSFLLALHTCTLIFRTFLSICVAKLEGHLTKTIVQRDFRAFAKKLMLWLLIALPATTCNSLIRYLESKLDLELKTQLVNKSHKYYFENRTYFKIALKNADSIQIDQNLTGKYDKTRKLEGC